MHGVCVYACLCLRVRGVCACACRLVVVVDGFECCGMPERSLIPLPLYTANSFGPTQDLVAFAFFSQEAGQGKENGGRMELFLSPP